MITATLSQSITIIASLDKVPVTPEPEARKTVISIVDDDGRTSFTDTGFKEYLESQNIPYGLSIVKSGAAGSSTSYYHVSDLLEIQSAGNDILNHYINFNSVTVDDLENLQTAKQYFEENGLNAGKTVFVYPNGEFNTDVRNLVGQVFDYGLNVEDYTQHDTYANSNSPSFGYWNQVPLQDSKNIVRKEVSSDHGLEEFKTNCDSAFENNGWIILFTHSKHATFSLDIVKSIIEYCQTKEVEFKTVTKAIEYINSFE